MTRPLRLVAIAASLAILVLSCCIALSFAAFASAATADSTSTSSSASASESADISASTDVSGSASTSTSGGASGSASTSESADISASKDASASASASAATTVCVIARVTAVYDTDASLSSVASGTLTLDESATDIAQKNVAALCSAVIDDEDLSISLAISPALIERWAEQMPTAGTTPLIPTDTSAQALSGTSSPDVITLLMQAQSTGRLEILSEGYGDPSFSLLSSIDRIDDIGRQYATSADIAPLSFSKGTAPADLALPEGAASALSDAGISWAAVDSTSLDTSASSPVGIFTSRENRNVSILGVDAGGSDLLLAGDTTRTAARIDAMASGSSSSSQSAVYAAVVEIGNVDNAGQALADSLESLAADGSYALMTSGAAVDAANAASTLPAFAGYRTAASTDDASGKDTPTVGHGEGQTEDGYEAELYRARQDVTALGDILYSSSTDYETALHLSLLAEFAGWEDDPEVGLACSRKASQLIDGLFNGIHLDVEDMVLASDDGAITIDIRNDTDAVFEIVLSYGCTDGMTVNGSDATGTTVLAYSGLNTIQIGVDMTDAAGELTVAAVSDGKTYASDTSKITTSHIDDITLVVCSAIAVAIVVGTIVRNRRSKAA